MNRRELLKSSGLFVGYAVSSASADEFVHQLPG